MSVEEIRLPMRAWLEHGPELLRVCRIARVTLTDRTPEFSRGCYCWCDDLTERCVRLHEIDEAIFVHMSDCRASGVGYGTEAQAREKLSSACLEWATSQLLWPQGGGMP
jgi:hypothetical protein